MQEHGFSSSDESEMSFFRSPMRRTYSLSQGSTISEVEDDQRLPAMPRSLASLANLPASASIPPSPSIYSAFLPPRSYSVPSMPTEASQRYLAMPPNASPFIASIVENRGDAASEVATVNDNHNSQVMALDGSSVERRDTASPNHHSYLNFGKTETSEYVDSPFRSMFMGYRVPHSTPDGATPSGMAESAEDSALGGVMDHVGASGVHGGASPGIHDRPERNND